MRAASFQLADGDRRKVEADGNADGAGDDWRHQSFDPACADGHDHKADKGIERAAGNDAAERDGDIGIGAGTAIAG